MTKYLEVPNVDKSNWANTTEGIVLHLKLARGVSGVPLAYVIKQYIKVMHIFPGYDVYLSLDEEMIAQAHLVNEMSNFRQTQDFHDRVYISLQLETFKTHNVLVYQMLSNIFADMNVYMYINRERV